MGKRWIVLIDKTPRGPLSEGEIRALLSQGIIRTNDVAYQVSDEPTAQKAEWKFLWQFDEFDRRRGVQQPKFPVLERRTPRADAEIEKEKEAILPQELSSIQPEDLVYHSTSTPDEKKGPLHLVDNSIPDDAPRFNTAPFFDWKWTLGLIPMFLLVGYFMVHSTSNKLHIAPKKGMEPLAIEKEEEETTPSREVTSSPLQGTQPHRQMQMPLDRRTAAPVQKPEARELPKPPEDKGEMSYDDYRKRQDEQMERDRRDDEELKRADSQEGDEDEDEPKVKKKKSKKRKAASEEVEEEGTDPLLQDDPAAEE